MSMLDVFTCLVILKFVQKILSRLWVLQNKIVITQKRKQRTAVKVWVKKWYYLSKAWAVHPFKRVHFFYQPKADEKVTTDKNTKIILIKILDNWNGLPILVLSNGFRTKNMIHVTVLLFFKNWYTENKYQALLVQFSINNYIHFLLLSVQSFMYVMTNMVGRLKIFRPSVIW